jgi:hypothetical protein
VITRVEVEVSMGTYTVYLMAQTAIRSPVNFCVHCGELNILVDIVQVVKEVPWPVRTLEADDTSCHPCNGTSTGVYRLPTLAPPIQSSRKKMVITGDSGKRIAMPSICL